MCARVIVLVQLVPFCSDAHHDLKHRRFRVLIDAKRYASLNIDEAKSVAAKPVAAHASAASALPPLRAPVRSSTRANRDAYGGEG